MAVLMLVVLSVCFILQQRQLRQITRRLNAVAAAADDVTFVGEYDGW